MRTPEDICLFCRINKATKTNSHILPRFISTDFLGPKGTAKRGYELTSDSPDTGRNKIIQDSAKENYILCEECEAYFGVLEGAAAPIFKLWREKVEVGEFLEEVINEHLSIVTCNGADPRVMRLLVYSMFWRASVSIHGMFENYKLSTEMEESLRSALMSMRSLTRAEFNTKLENAQIIAHPYAAVTAKSFQDETANVVAGLNWGNPASLHVDRFGFLLWADRSDVRDPVFSSFANFTDNDRMIVVLAENLWRELMVEKTFAYYVESVKARQGR